MLTRLTIRNCSEKQLAIKDNILRLTGKPIYWSAKNRKNKREVEKKAARNVLEREKSLDHNYLERELLASLKLLMQNTFFCCRKQILFNEHKCR